VHRREDVRATGGEDPRHLGDHTRRVRDEHEGVLVKDDVELSVAEGAQVSHVRSEVRELGTAASCQAADRRELRAADVHEGGRRAELREEDRVPAAAASQR
jgi:hypothetical protein